MSSAAPGTQNGTSLHELLQRGAKSKDIAAHLDAMSPSARVAEVLGITGKWVGKLYDAVGDGPAASLEDLVAAGEKGTIAHEGRNSLPLFTRFQKRFLRLEDGQVIGYNHQTVSFLTGPGYFVVHAPSGEGPFAKELELDYTMAPPAQPAGWPAYKPNDRGFSTAVYGNMKDYVRRVARGVVVGKAYRHGVEQNAYFTLSLP